MESYELQVKFPCQLKFRYCEKDSKLLLTSMAIAAQQGGI